MFSEILKNVMNLWILSNRHPFERAAFQIILETTSLAHGPSISILVPISVGWIMASPSSLSQPFTGQPLIDLHLLTSSLTNPLHFLHKTQIQMYWAQIYWKLGVVS